MEFVVSCSVSGGSFSTDYVDGDEPEPSAGGFQVLVYSSGYLSNAREVSDVLGGDRTSSVWVRAYEKWGCDLSAHLLGQYCFAIYDRARCTLIAGGDSLGIIRPIVYRHGSRFWVTSKLDLLLSCLSAQPPLNRGAIADFVGCGGTLGTSGQTVYDKVSFVPAGLIWAVDPAGVVYRRSALWPPRFTTPSRRASLADHADELRSLLCDAVRASLSGVSSAIVDLSGGLDSSTVAAFAAKVRASEPARNLRLTAFSLVASVSSRADETEWQDMVLKQHPMDQRRFDIDQLPDALDFSGIAEPGLQDIQPWGLIAQRQLARELPVEASLSGQGGDAVFALALPPMHLAEELRHGRLISWAREIRRWVRGGRFAVWPLLAIHSRGDALRAYGLPPVMPMWLRRDAVTIEGPWEQLMTTRYGRFITNPRLFHLQMVMNLAASLPDRARLPWSPRYPLLYRPLVEFLVGLPHVLKCTPIENRILQRLALKGVLPEALRQRRTKGDFTGRFFRGLREYWSIWEPLTCGRRLGDLGIVEPKQFRLACERLRHGDATDFPYLSAALVMEAWLGTVDGPRAGIGK